MNIYLRHNKYLALILVFTVIAVSAGQYVFAEQTSEAKSAAIIAEIRAEANLHVESESPPRTKDVVDLFKDNKVGVTSKEIRQIYRKYYREAKKVHDASKKKKETIKPVSWVDDPIAWLVGIVLFFGGVFLTFLRNKALKFLSNLSDAIYNQFAGLRIVRRFALRQYCKALINKYSKINIPFRPDRPLDMHDVFVPLHMSVNKNDEEIYAHDAFLQNTKLMIKGPPGSGKSMLLRKTVLSIAERDFRLGSNFVVPIFLELHRLNTQKSSIHDHLIDALARNHFPKAERFLQQGLDSGWFLVMFDGLDEVTDKVREAVVQQVRDFMEQNANCRYAITCRTAVYNNEFDAHTNASLDIVEFTDQQIWRFLKAWEKEIPSGKTVNQLIAALRDRPGILKLARNPLLLTIISHLFCDTQDFILPHSRGDFYQQSTELLLHRWHSDIKINQFNPHSKRLILQRLALTAQDRALEKGRDRRSLSFKETLALVRAELPSLDIDKDDAAEVLAEIVERSGLLLKIDGGARFQFAHLTLQEYFAGEALQTDEAGLVQRFNADNTTWREVAKLWCSLAPDCSSLVDKVGQTDPLTAFECIADARKIEPATAESLIEKFKPQLNEGADESIITAFGNVAAALRGRGKSVFAFLEDTLRNDPDQSRKKAAAEALMYTNLPNAADLLFEIYNETGLYSEQLVRMGDLATTNLRDHANQGSIMAVDLLGEIGTPAAAEALSKMLWHNNEALATRSAWQLGALLKEKAVKSVLSNHVVSEEKKKAPAVDWIWYPFAKDKNSSICALVGRLAHLIAYSPEDAIPERVPAIDERIAFPILIIIIKLAALKSNVDTATMPEDIKTALIKYYKKRTHHTDDYEESGWSRWYREDKQKIAEEISFILSSEQSFTESNFPVEKYWDLATTHSHKKWFYDSAFEKKNSLQVKKLFLSLNNNAKSWYYNFVNRKVSWEIPKEIITPYHWKTMFEEGFDLMYSWHIWLSGLCAVVVVTLASIYSISISPLVSEVGWSDVPITAWICSICVISTIGYSCYLAFEIGEVKAFFLGLGVASILLILSVAIIKIFFYQLKSQDMYNKILMLLIILVVSIGGPVTVWLAYHELLVLMPSDLFVKINIDTNNYELVAAVVIGLLVIIADGTALRMFQLQERSNNPLRYIANSLFLQEKQDSAIRVGGVIVESKHK